MRILASNPDTIGDMVLRQPLYRALCDAGHELLLIVRRSVAPLVPYLAPGARVLVLPAETYRDDIGEDWAVFADLFGRAREFQPELLLVAPYQWTRFEEQLAQQLGDGVKRAGMNGHLYPGDPHAGRTPVSALRFDLTAEVPQDAPEVLKNAAFAELLLGHAIDPTPRLTPTDAALAVARQVISDLGLEPGAFWIGCVTGTAHVPIKNWLGGRWSQLLRHWTSTYDRRFLLVGLPEERPAAEAIRDGMGDLADRVSIRMEPNGSIDELVALASLAGGYAGHDTGPMHIAAACGKPVFAIFGGGHRQRFFPWAEPSVSLTMGVACAGCGWACSFSTSHCVKDVPLESAIAAVDDLEIGRIIGRRARVLTPPVDLLNRMVAESSDLARRRLRESVEQAHTVETLKDGLDAARANVSRLDDEAKGLLRQLAEREAEVVSIREQSAEAAKLAEAVLAEQKLAREQREADVTALRKKVQELEATVHRLEQPPPPPAPVIKRRPRRPWREVATDLVCGSRDYVPSRPIQPLPSITLAVWTDGATPSQIRTTLSTLQAQAYPYLDVVLAGRNTDALLDDPEIDHRFARLLPHKDGGFAGVAAALDQSEADVVSWITAGDVPEPGLLLRAGEHFRDHPRSVAVYYDDTHVVNGWTTPPTDRPRMGVYSLLNDPADVTAFIRRREYDLFGPIDPQKNTAAGWDLLIRFARRYGFRHGEGHGVRRSAVVDGAASRPDVVNAEDLGAARDRFLSTFGSLAKMRCRSLRLIDRTMHTARRLRKSGPRPAAAWQRSSGTLPPLAVPGQERSEPGSASTAGVIEERWEVRPGTGTGPNPALVVPLAPLTHRPPGVLLFSGRDTTTTDFSTHSVYYDPAGDTAVVHPALVPEELAAHYQRRAAAAGSEIVQPDDVSQSPYPNYRGGRWWQRLLVRLPTPYWRIKPETAGDPSARRLVTALNGRIASESSANVLVVGAFDGTVLDQLKTTTKWRLAGVESNADAAAKAREKGHAVWHATPLDAPMAVETDEPFDVIFLRDVLSRLADPAQGLRRLMLMLKPGGMIAFNAPNLDGIPAKMFGPTWSRWNLPFHRTILGRRGVRELARVTDLKILSRKTITDRFPAARSAALAKAGLGVTIPDGAPLPNEASSAGAKIAGWARMIWDWRGKGDEWWIVAQVSEAT